MDDALQISGRLVSYSLLEEAMHAQQEKRTSARKECFQYLLSDKLRSITCSFVWTTDLPNKLTLLYQRNCFLQYWTKSRAREFYQLLSFETAISTEDKPCMDPLPPTQHTQCCSKTYIHDQLSYVGADIWKQLPLSKRQAFTIKQFSFLTQDVKHNGYQYEVQFISVVS